MEKDTELKQIISIAIIQKKTPAEIEKIILDLIIDYDISVNKLIEEIKTLNLTDVQKEKISGLANYNKRDCQESKETLKYLALSEYETKKEGILNRLNVIIDRNIQENKKIEKSQKGKKIKINHKETDQAIKNKQENFNYANFLIDNMIDEIKSSKKGMLNYLSSIQFVDEQQRKVEKYVKKFEEDVLLIIHSTVLKKIRVEKVLDERDIETCKEVAKSIKYYVENEQTLNPNLDFQNRRNVFIENLQEKTDIIKEEPKQDEEKDLKNLIEEIEPDEK